MTTYRAIQLKGRGGLDQLQEVALSLGIPMYGADPRLADLGSKTGCRRMFEELGVQCPVGAEDLHTVDEIVAVCRERIGGYKVPRSVAIRSEPLPKSGAGKILKRSLRDPYWQRRERGVN